MGADFWHLIPTADVAKKLPYNNARSGNPECMQGLIYMDQQCTTESKLPNNYSCATFGGRVSENEYLTAFGKWDESSHCVTLMRSAWTFGEADRKCTICRGEAPTFCQTNFAEVGPCDVGAYFKGPFIFDLQKTSFGWDRVSPLGPISPHYPVLRVVDGRGRKTKWFGAYMEEVSRTECPPNQQNCRLNEWAASGQMANCLRSSCGAEECQMGWWVYIVIALVMLCLLAGIAFCVYRRSKGGSSTSSQTKQEYDRVPLVAGSSPAKADA